MAAHAEHADFHRLESRLRLQGELETKTALRIGGTSGAFDGANLPVLRDADGYPLIPGSSLKGVLRSTVEAIVRGANPSADPTPADALWACDPLSERDTDMGTCGRHRSGDDQRTAALGQPHCSVCQLFGSRVIASHVRISDAMLKDAETLKRSGRIPIEVRDGVAIDRDLRTAYGGQKYDFEVVAPGTIFDLELFVENPRPWLMGLLTIGLDQLAEGFTAVGGFTSRGLGRVTLRWNSFTRYDANALLAGEPPTETAAPEIPAQFVQWREALAQHTLGER